MDDRPPMFETPDLHNLVDQRSVDGFHHLQPIRVPSDWLSHRIVQIFFWSHPELEESEVKIIRIQNTDGFWMIPMFIFTDVPRRTRKISMKEISTCQNTQFSNCIPVVVRNRLSNVKPLSKARPSKSIRKPGRWVALIRNHLRKRKEIHFQPVLIE